MQSRLRGYCVPLLLAVICSPYSWALAQGNSAAPAEAVAPSIPALTLGDALRLALAHNTELASARLEVQAMEAAEMQAGARPNPELGVLVEDTRRPPVLILATVRPRSELEPGNCKLIRRCWLLSVASHCAID